MSIDSDGSGLRVYKNVKELIRGLWPTPLVRLESFGDVWAKLEFFNPLSRSIKDRVAYYIVERYKVKCRKILDATSGNYGIALALLSKIYGLDLTLLLPKRVEKYVKTILRVIDVNYIETNIELNNEDMIRKCEEVSQMLEACFINQFENPSNPEAHYLYTGREIVNQFKSISKKPDILIAAVGTSGHICGISRALKENFEDVKVVGVVCRADSHIPGMKPINAGIRWLDSVDYIVEVSLEDAVRGVIEVARREGLLIGLSSGAVVTVLERFAMEKFGRDKTYLLIFPDDIFKYIDTLDRVLSMLKVS